MKATRRERRAAARHIGRREIDRRATAAVRRVLQLADEGHSPAAVASSTGLTEKTVVGVLELKEREDS